MDAERTTLLRRIRENEIPELVVNKVVARLLADPEELVSALQENTSIQSCSIILRFLDPEYVPLSHQVAFLQAIASLPSLKDFRFVTTSTGYTDPALHLLTAFLQNTGLSPKLKRLTLQTIEFDIRGAVTTEVFTNGLQVLAEFRRALCLQTSLETLVLDGTDERFDLCGVIETLHSMPSVKHIDIKAKSVTNRYHRESMESLLQVRSATTSTLSIKRFLMAELLSPFFSLLAGNAILVDLTLEQVGISNEACSLLAQSLTQNSTLQRLSIAYNGLRDTSAASLLTSLKHNNGLTELNIAGNMLSEESSQALADLLTDSSSLSTLTNLNLAQNIFIGTEGASIIASALAIDTKITHLNLSEMKLSSVVSALLADSLASNSTLLRLNLTKNSSLGDDGAIHMANLLRVNKTLQHLNLSGTRIGQKGADALARVLMDENDTLVSLNLGGNSMILNPKPFEAMIVANPTLEHLWLPSHLLQDDSPIPPFFKLNKFGRRRILQDRNNSLLWKSALIHFASDLCVSYYLLQMNPAIMSWI